MRNVCAVLAVAMLFGIVGMVHANLDDFDGPDLDPMWTLRDPESKATVSFADGNLVLDLAAGADMYIAGVDAGVMLLMDPPAMDDYTMEMKLNVATEDGAQAPACHVGIVLFDEADWVYSAWGPYANTDIRLEDCAGEDYRWRDQTQVGVDLGEVAIDQDLWIQVVKTGDQLEFLTKGNEADAWVSGGMDDMRGPNYTQGDYQVGVVAKSWGGSIDTTFELDYFNIPELDNVTAVQPTDKLATTWSEIKR